MAIEGKGGRPPGYPKTGGRQKGTPNKATQDVAELLAAMGCYPLQGIARIALDLKNSTELRLRGYEDLLPYVASKRKPIDVSVEQETVTNVITTLNSSPGGSDDGNKSEFKS
jgi:hypothetical protein